MTCNKEPAGYFFKLVEVIYKNTKNDFYIFYIFIINTCTRMFKIIKLNDFSYPDSLSPFSEDPMFQIENFKRSLVGKGSTDVLDLEKRSSWVHVNKFRLPVFPFEVLQFMEQNNILTSIYDNFDFIKYEEGDFFLNHRDTCMLGEVNSEHAYTCLIFCPFGEDYQMLEGGELILREPDGSYEIKFDSSVETRNGRYVMVIFSIDMYHEVLPIIKGTRYVFKKPLFVKKTVPKPSLKHVEEDLCDGGGGYFQGAGGGRGDY